MDNLRSILEIVFLKRDLDALLSGLTTVDNSSGDCAIPVPELKEKFQNIDSRYSGNQLDTLFDVVQEDWMGFNDPSVFNILTRAAKQLLTIDGVLPVCMFEEYLRWHEITKSIGEDLLTTSFLAEKDLTSTRKRSHFGWKPVLTTDNHKLTHLFNKGLAELHFHLKGSSLNCDINWMSLMNNPSLWRKKDFKGFQNNEALYSEVILASMLRIFLYLQVNNIYSGETAFQKFIDRWLKSKDKKNDCLLGVKTIDNEVKVITSRYGRKFGIEYIDYAIPGTLSELDNKAYANIPLIGERKLLYECFRLIFEHKEPCNHFRDLFYVYLVCKTKFRNSIIQTNQRRGFENFKCFEDEKSIFIKKDSIYDKLLIFEAFQSTLCNQNIDYIEMRIAPKDTKNSIRNEIKSLKKSIHNKAFLNGCADKTKNVDYGFILHFIKKHDPAQYFADTPANNLICRNSLLRADLTKRTSAVYALLSDTDSNVIGIDAANSEFGCRPEVFSYTFRKLQSIRKNDKMNYFYVGRQSRIGRTFHVGEDFYDIVDGLRAIEEAKLFLNLKDGDRLGHAMALGVDCKSYYEENHYTVVFHMQDLLDNIAWLLYKVDNYSITDASGLLPWFREQYRKFTYDLLNEDISLYSYIQSWLLRGDSPDLYKSDIDDYSKFDKERLLDKCLLCDSDISITTARKNKEARQLYNRYHYDASAKCNGFRSVEFKIPRVFRESYIKILTEIQDRMQLEIGYRNIFIETNLTSNLRISKLSSYSAHPVVRYYNEGLELTNSQKSDCPQLNVSINTDDQGIFSTSLEKEYTLISLALKKQKDINGEDRYKQYSIYRWLDNVRNNAYIQKFKI